MEEPTVNNNAPQQSPDMQASVNTVSPSPTATAEVPPPDLKTEWIKDPATRIALITGFVSVLITLLNALLR